MSYETKTRGIQGCHFTEAMPKYCPFTILYLGEAGVKLGYGAEIKCRKASRRDLLKGRAASRVACG
jgi:hypothetical protein